jgi:hypothetical protein
MDRRRLNPFKGLFLHAEDWQAAQAYWIAKEQIQNLALSGEGIVRGYLSNLSVEVSADGTALTVAPGLAINRKGQLLLLSEPQSIPVEPQAHPVSSGVYLVLTYDEERVDHRENVANPEYSGFAFVREFARLELTETPPAESDSIELARISFAKNATRVRKAADPATPKPNEVDLEHRKYTGFARSRSLFYEFARRVTEGKINVNGNGTSRILIEEVPSEDSHRFYSASCQPTRPGVSISWKLMASSENAKGSIEYMLDLENFSSIDVEVSYEVYRLA